jgi:signal transduction histidine kinase
VSGVNPIRPLREFLRTHELVSSGMVAAVVLLLSFLGQVGSGPASDPPTPAPTTSAVVLVVLGCLVLVLRRRYPVGVWAAILVIGVLGVVVQGDVTQTVLAAMVAVYTVASWRPWRTAIAVALATAVIYGGAAALVTRQSLLTDSTYAFLAVGGMSVAIGVAVRGQRAILTAAEERARVAEQTREDEAQRRVTEERLRIARELHDVVAHHISVINVQAGVARHLLESQPAAAAEALGHVRDSSAVVLSEMGTILGLLRTPEDPSSVAPAPGLDQVDALVESVRRSGLDVSWRVSGTPTALGPGTELAAYRLVQESLTNARKHGSGRVDLAIAYDTHSVRIDVVNATRPGAEQGDSGHGLIGMRERVAAVGGTLQAGPGGGGQFEVHATMPTDPRFTDPSIPAGAS